MTDKSLKDLLPNYGQSESTELLPKPIKKPRKSRGKIKQPARRRISPFKWALLTSVSYGTLYAAIMPIKDKAMLHRQETRDAFNRYDARKLTEKTFGDIVAKYALTPVSAPVSAPGSTVQ